VYHFLTQHNILINTSSNLIIISFDVATIEREWTLCADNNDDLQMWLQLIAAAVDEDVAIVPDDTLSFYVKVSEWGLKGQQAYVCRF
jgi:hypothetical protein